MSSGSMTPELARTILTCRAKNGSSAVDRPPSEPCSALMTLSMTLVRTGQQPRTAARAPVISTTGPATHRRRQPTRLTACRPDPSRLLAPVALRIPDQHEDMQPAASQTWAQARGPPASGCASGLSRSCSRSLTSVMRVVPPRGGRQFRVCTYHETLPSMTTAGAKLQAPRQRAFSRDTLRSSVVSPGFMPSRSWIRPRSAEAG